MNAAAKAVMKELPDIVLAYGVSDEFSFVLHKDCILFERRERLVELIPYLTGELSNAVKQTCHHCRIHV
jgi:tRNA(His) 5'-end guanylyltransferase